MSTGLSLRIHGAAQVVRVAAEGEKMKIKDAMSDLAIIEGPASVLVGSDGLIVAVGLDSSPEIQKWADVVAETTVNATGKVILPGFVDGHTHPVWAGERVGEFAMKLAGASYMEIHEAGGGIGYTVTQTQNASESDLLDSLLTRLDRMVTTGTTAVETKSGYGLESDTELKMLRVLHSAASRHAMHIVSNFCGAHSVPKGSNAEEATKDVVERQIPAVAAAIKEGTISPTLIDVFLEKGVFNYEQTEAILKAGASLGLKANFHGDELSFQKSGELAGSLNALAVSHLEYVSPEGIAEMARVGSFGVLLPTTAYILRLVPPPARDMIAAGVPVALGSDFNPNAHCSSMPFVMHLACVLMKMTLPEALVAATLNAAGSMGIADKHGSIEVGKFGNLVLLDAHRWEHVVYQLHSPPIESVFINGKPVYSAPPAPSCRK